MFKRPKLVADDVPVGIIEHIFIKISILYISSPPPALAPSQSTMGSLRRAQRSC